MNHAHTSQVGAASETPTIPHTSTPISRPNVSAGTAYHSSLPHQTLPNTTLSHPFTYGQFLRGEVPASTTQPHPTHALSSLHTPHPAQRPNKNENHYADRIAAAARDCANVFEDYALVHYYVRGLLATTRGRVTEHLRRLPEKERNDLTAIQRLATAQVNTYRAQVQAAENTKAHTRAKPRTQTLYVAPDPTRNPRRDSNVPHLPGHERMGFLSDLRNDDPELAERIADGLESILYLGDPGKSVTTTPTTMDSREIAAIVGVNLKETPVLRDTTCVPKLTEEQMRKAFSVIPTDYWQLNCWMCRECGHSTFTCPTLTAGATGVLRSSVLSRPSPYESDDGLVPSAEDSTTIGPSERTSPRRNDRTK